MHGGNVDAGKNVLAAVASDDTSSGGRRTGTREDGRTRSKPLSLSYKPCSHSGCQASSSRGSDKKSGNKRSPRLISLGSSASSVEDDLESDGEMNK